MKHIVHLEQKQCELGYIHIIRTYIYYMHQYITVAVLLCTMVRTYIIMYHMCQNVEERGVLYTRIVRGRQLAVGVSVDKQQWLTD